MEKIEEDEDAGGKWLVSVMTASGGIMLFVGLLIGWESISGKMLVAVGIAIWGTLAVLAITAVAVEMSAKEGW